LDKTFLERARKDPKGAEGNVTRLKRTRAGALIKQVEKETGAHREASGRRKTNGPLLDRYRERGPNSPTSS